MKTLKLKSPADGLELSVLVREADGPSMRTVQLVHGMCEHKERYIPFMDFLATEPPSGGPRTWATCTRADGRRWSKT